MKTNPYLPIAVHGLLFTTLTGSLYAIPTSINGNMSFSGSATTDSSSLLSATKFLSFQELSVGSPSTVSGDYAGDFVRASVFENTGHAKSIRSIDTDLALLQELDLLAILLHHVVAGLNCYAKLR